MFWLLIYEESYRQTLQSENEESVPAEGPQIFYGSIHYIFSIRLRSAIS